MDRNTILAIVVSLAIWIGYFYLFPPAKPEKKQAQPGLNSELAKKKTAPEKKIEREKRERPPRTRIVKTVQVSKPRLSSAKNPVAMENNMFRMEVTPRGGHITSFKYKKYKEKTNKPVELVIKSDKYKGEKNWPFAISFENSTDSFLDGDSLKEPMIYSLTRNESNNNNKKILYINASATILLNKMPVKISKEYSIQENENLFTLKLTLRNQSKWKTIENVGRPMLPIGNLVGPNLDLNDPYNPMYFGYYSGDTHTELSKESSIFSGNPPAITKAANQEIRWFGVHSRYFLMNVIPQSPVMEIWADTRPNTPFAMGARLEKIVIGPNGHYQKTFFIYIGEKEKSSFHKLAQELKSKGYHWTNIVDSMKKTIDVHWSIEIVRDLVIRLLIFLNSIFGNYGVALLLFAILTKVIFWPLNQKSANSMKKMSELAPHLKTLKEKYKDNPTELNKQTMGIYRKHGVNPASGCLPIIIQMPFFFALYSALSNSVVLWNAPFMLWITDLSRPDTIMVLPSYLGGINLNILPLFMVVSQFFQQKLTSSTADPNQQKMMAFLPLVFIFIFWSMPSGLVLYWSVQNVLSIVQQVYTNKRSDKVKVKEKEEVVQPDRPASRPPRSSRSKRSKRK